MRGGGGGSCCGGGRDARRTHGPLGEARRNEARRNEARRGVTCSRWVAGVVTRCGGGTARGLCHHANNDAAASTPNDCVL